MRSQWLAVGVLVAVLGAGLWGATRYIGGELRELRVGSAAPEFEVADATGASDASKSLADYRGQVLLLNVWATWCGPCKQEMPSIEQLYRDFAARGLAVAAVSVDAPGVGPDIERFARDYELTFDVLYDESESFRTVYRYAGVPETYLIDRSGVIRRRWLGADNWNSDANRRFIAQLLAEPGA